MFSDDDDEDAESSLARSRISTKHVLPLFTAACKAVLPESHISFKFMDGHFFDIIK